MTWGISRAIDERFLQFLVVTGILTSPPNLLVSRPTMRIKFMLFAVAVIAPPVSFLSAQQTEWLYSGKSGPWSAPATWAGGKVPGAGAMVHIRPGHTVVYDVDSEAVIRTINLGGALTFARDKNTRLDVGLL